MTTRIETADRIYRETLQADGTWSDDLAPTAPPTPDIDLVLRVLTHEATASAVAISRTGFLDLRELFANAFLTGVIAAHREGLGWAEWLIEQRTWPLVNLGTCRAAARRIAAGATYIGPADPGSDEGQATT